MKKRIHFSDSALVEAILQMEHLDEAIWQLYPEHAEINRSFIMGKNGTEHDADDIYKGTRGFLYRYRSKREIPAGNGNQNLSDSHFKTSQV